MDSDLVMPHRVVLPGVVNRIVEAPDLDDPEVASGLYLDHDNLEIVGSVADDYETEEEE